MMLCLAAAIFRWPDAQLLAWGSASRELDIDALHGCTPVEEALRLTRAPTHKALQLLGAIRAGAVPERLDEPTCKHIVALVDSVGRTPPSL